MPLLADSTGRSTALAGAKLRAMGPTRPHAISPELLTNSGRNRHAASSSRHRMKQATLRWSSRPTGWPKSTAGSCPFAPRALRPPPHRWQSASCLDRSPNGVRPGAAEALSEVASSRKTFSSAMYAAHRSRPSRRSMQYTPVTFPENPPGPVFVCARSVRHRDPLHCCCIACSSVAPSDPPLLCEVPAEPTQGRCHVLRHF